MAGDSTTDRPVPCAGAPRNCELLASLGDLHVQRCADAGISGPEAIVNAMAVGLVIEVWRNGPVEAMHGSRRGPDDAAMFAESTALHSEAVEALTANNRVFGLLGFERHLLDRKRPWAGTGGRTLKDLGTGFLGHYARHVKDRTNALIDLGDHTCIDDPLQVYLVKKALAFGRDHMGMPGWPVIVERIGILLADPGHPAWHEDSRGTQALTEMPQQAPPVEQLNRHSPHHPVRPPGRGTGMAQPPPSVLRSATVQLVLAGHARTLSLERGPLLGSAGVGGKLVQGCGDGVAAEVLDPLVQVPGLRRSVVERAGELGADGGQAFRKLCGALGGGQPQHRLDGDAGGVEVACAEPDGGQVGAGTRLPAVLVRLTGGGSRCVHFGGAFELGGGLGSGAGNLDEGGTCQRTGLSCATVEGLRVSRQRARRKSLRHRGEGIVSCCGRRLGPNQVVDSR
jgi:hypothetical protein